MPLPGPSTLRILVTTDNHVGFCENDPIRGDDAWKSFDEIMNIAKTHDVDMILCAGDLFHVNKPSKKAYYEVIKSLRKACLGDKPVELQVLYDGPLKTSMPPDDELPSVNYYDKNMNIAIPFFSISGNHDDVSGVSMLAAMDVLAATGLVNYFGKVPENDNINVEPILLKKGDTKLALYGFDSVRDERLFRTFRAGNVKFSRPAVNENDYFNLIAVHQNRVAHTETSFLRDEFIPDFMNLVVWGHEHDSRPDPELSATQGFQILQPGSSVATSLAEGEALPKYVDILNITGKSLEIEKIRLSSVRPFVFENIKLTDIPVDKDSEISSQVTRWMIEKVEKMINRAKTEWKESHSNSQDNDFPLPLIRLRIEHNNQCKLEHPLRFSARFSGKVANVEDVVQYLHRRTVVRSRPQKLRSNQVETVSDDSDNEDLSGVKVQDLVREELEKEELEMLLPKALTETIRIYVEKDDRSVLKKFVKESIDDQTRRLEYQHELTTEDILKRLNLEEQMNGKKTPATKKAKNSATKVTRQPKMTKKKKVSEDVVGDDENTRLELSDDDDEDVVIASSDEDDFDLEREEVIKKRSTTSRGKRVVGTGDLSSMDVDRPIELSSNKTAPARGSANRSRGGRGGKRSRI